MSGNSRRGLPLAYVAAAAVATVSGAVGNRPVAAATKPIPLALLGIQLARTSASSSDRRLLYAALGAHLVGDAAMYFEEFAAPDNPAKDRYLQTAATSFGVGHVVLSSLLRRRGARLRARTALPRIAAMSTSGLTVLHNKPALLPVLGTYGSVLATLAALGASPELPAAQRRALTAGGLVFMASDSILVQRRFLATTGTQRTVGEVGVLATYFAAQGLIYPALFRLVSR